VYGSAGASVFFQLVTEPICQPAGIGALAINAFYCLGAWLAFRRSWWGAILCSVISLLGAAVLVPYFMTPVNPDPELSLGPGYYLWVFSMVLLVADTVVKRFVLE
jgi:hypothetical protein